MRSSKSRSRGKNRNNNRPSGGNIINRVFDSSGPDGKVRGTPQQIIDKYQQLHRDAQLAGDRVAAENFAQHAEHYLRLLAEAQKEVDRAREEQEEENRRRQAERDRERAERFKAQEEAASASDDQPEVAQAPDAAPAEQPVAEAQPQPRQERQPRPERQPRAPRPQKPREDDVIDTSSQEDDNGLVDTPEDKAPVAPAATEASADEPKKAPRKPRARKPKPKSDGGPDDSATAAE